MSGSVLPLTILQPGRLAEPASTLTEMLATEPVEGIGGRPFLGRHEKIHVYSEA